MNNLSNGVVIEAEKGLVPEAAQALLSLPGILEPRASHSLQRMFRDPRVLEPQERDDLIQHLRRAVAIAPKVPEIRVLLGMALCVGLEGQEALEELRQAVNMSPDCFVARLKFGELLMRLRICDQAAEHTHRAAELASNAAQSELARRQAATIRTMQREGIERGGYTGLLAKLKLSRVKPTQKRIQPILAASE
jgi:tetratricopeptide (TPR) repeat protein